MPVPNPRIHDMEELKAWILRQLGAPTVTVHLTCEQMQDAIDRALRWFAAKVGIRKEWTFNSQPQVPGYALPDEADFVMEVVFESTPLELSLMAVPGTVIPDAQYPWYAMTAPSAGGLYSSIIQSVQTVETAKRAISADRRWLVEGRTLYLQPTPQTSFKVLAYYKSAYVGLDQLNSRQSELVRRYALARAKETLGQVYSRYGSFPGAQGGIQLNGADLLAQAQSELEGLSMDILNEGVALPLFKG